MSLNLTKTNTAILILTLLALISMSFNFMGDTLFDMLGVDSRYYYGIELVFVWTYLISYAFINIFHFIAKKDFALLFSGINLLSLTVLFADQIIFYNHPEFGLGFWLLTAFSISIFIICFKTRRIHDKQSNETKQINEG